MPTPGPWLTPPPQTVTDAPIVLPSWIDRESFDFTSDDAAIAGTGTVNDATDSHNAWMRPRAIVAGTLTPADVRVGVWLLAPTELPMADYIPSLPPGASSYETDTTDTPTVVYPVTVAPGAARTVVCSNVDGSPHATPGDLTAVLKRLTPADYTTVFSTFWQRTSVGLAGGWLPPGTIAARSTVMSFDGSSTTPASFTVAAADLDAGGFAVWWDGPSYFEGGVMPSFNVTAELPPALTYTYTPRRYRFLYDGRPPLAHRQRLDGTDTVGPPLAQVATAGLVRPTLAWRQSTP